MSTVVLLGLQIDGRPVISPTSHGWQATCYELLWLMPYARALDRACIIPRLLQENLGDEPPSDSTDDVMQQYAQAYIWLCLEADYLRINQEMTFGFS